MNILSTLRHVALYAFRASGILCIALSVVVLGALLSATETTSYLYYTDYISSSTGYVYFLASLAHGARYYLGITAWLLVPMLAYVGLIMLQVLPLRREWDRLCASSMLFIVIPNLCALWRSVCPVSQVGFFGYSGVRYMLQITDAWVIGVSMTAITAAAIVVITRSAVTVMMYRFCQLLHHHRVVARMGYAVQMAALAIYTAVATTASWCWSFVRNRIGEKYPELNEYQLDELDEGAGESAENSFGDIARDAFWQSYGAEKPTGDESIPDGIPSFHEPSNTRFTESTQQQTPEVHNAHNSEEAPQESVSMGGLDEVPSAGPSISVQQTYRLPDLSIFTAIPIVQRNQAEQDALRARAHILEDKLKHFGIVGKVVSIEYGPVITLFEYQPNVDMKVSKILALEDDLALALQALSIRIIAPVPGKAVVGFEVANRSRRDVLFSEIVHSSAFREFTGALPLILGQDSIGNNIVIDLLKSPHLLVAGSTGSGKSVALNTMLVSLLCSKSPDELRLILIDPKRLEFAAFADIPHLLFPIVVQPNRSIEALKWVVHTMEARYDQMAELGVRNVSDYHERFGETGKKDMPFIVVVIDELADLMMTTGKQVEDLITRIAQMARAAGIHMILATQRPSVDVITGLIKVNFPSRISFRVTSKVDSRTILDCMGAEKLLGRGDMLYMDASATSLARVHGAYVSDSEIDAVVRHARDERPTQYLDLSQFESSTDKGNLMEGDDSLYTEVLAYLDDVDEVSISLLQRKFRIGYNRSARIIEMLEGEGRVLSSDGSKMRKVIRPEA